ncbi:MAG: (Fe-S)-binding protein [bacterium]
MFEEPRRVIRAIPEVEYLELSLNRRYSTCCGGGGDLEMIDSNLCNKIAENLVLKIEEKNPDIAITACGQCKRITQNAIKAKGSKVKVMDIVELVLMAT